MNRSVAKSAGVIGGLTSISRVLGFIRDMVIAAAFGTGLGAEAFVVSFKIPNLLRDLVGEGAANSAFVPVLTECREKKPDHFWSLVTSLFCSMAVILIVLSVLGIFFAPQIVALIAPGFVHSSDPDKFPLTVKLTRVIFPYIFLIGLSALAMGVLNTLREFKSSAFGPALLNITLIIAGVYFEKDYGPMALVVGVLIGGALQLWVQIPPLMKSGFRWVGPSSDHGYGRKIGKLLLPRAFGSALYQINVFVDSILASFEQFVGAGGQSALYYSNRIFQLPLAIFGVSLAQALLPAFSTQMVRQDKDGFRTTFSGAVRTLIFVALPASAGLLVLCRPIVRILFETGKFNAYSTEITSSALFYYAFGLLSCCLIKVLVNAFYAMQDTRTPVKTMLFAVMLNIGLSFVFMRHLKIGGLSLASTLSATVNLIMLYQVLKKRMGYLDEKRILVSFIRIFCASLLMAIFAWAFHHWVMETRLESSRLIQALTLAGCIVSSVAVYYVACLFLQVEEARKLFAK